MVAAPSFPYLRRAIMIQTPEPTAPALGEAWSGEGDRVFQRSLNPTLMLDDERRYVDVNDAACSFLGLSRDEVLRRKVDDFLVPDVRSTLGDSWPKFLASGRHAGFFELVLPDGSVRRT